MKRSLLLTLTLTSLLLGACQRQQEQEAPSSTQSSSRQSSSASSSAPKQDVQALYQPILDCYQINGHYDYYAFYDTDKNGTDELLLANKLDSDYHLGLLVYAKGEGTALLPESSAGEGRRLSIVLYSEGRLVLEAIDSYNGGGEASLYQVKADNSGLDKVKTVDLATTTSQEAFALDSQQAVDLTTLPWQAFDRSSTTGGSMDLNGLSRGDYTSIIGTWQNARGDQLVFDANGLVGDHHILADSVQIDNEVMTVQVQSGVSGFAMSFIPAGEVYQVAGVMEASDQTKDRIWAGQESASVSLPEVYYYKID